MAEAHVIPSGGWFSRWSRNAFGKLLISVISGSADCIRLGLHRRARQDVPVPLSQSLDMVKTCPPARDDGRRLPQGAGGVCAKLCPPAPRPDALRQVLCRERLDKRV